MRNALMAANACSSATEMKILQFILRRQSESADFEVFHRNPLHFQQQQRRQCKLREV